MMMMMMDRPTYIKSLKRCQLIIPIALLVIGFVIVYVLVSYRMGFKKHNVMSATSHTANRIILISLDGFRFDYLQRSEHLPFITSLGRGGTIAPLQPQFPSNTFPNHLSLVTGLFPAYHGIVGNRFYDSNTGEVFDLHAANHTDSKWWIADPIWNLAEARGIKTAISAWPGSNAKINQRSPTYSKSFDPTIELEESFNQLTSWISTDPFIKFLALYIPTLDEVNHQYGPESIQVNAALSLLDQELQRFYKKLTHMGLQSNTDIIIVGDHGIAALDHDHVLPIEAIVDGGVVKWIDYGPVTSIVPIDGVDHQILFSEIQQAIKRQKYPIQVYRNDTTPEQYHLRNSSRIAPIILVCSEGWTIQPAQSQSFSSGQHGYDPALPSMHSIFIANGPSFKANKSILPIQSNLEVFPILTRLLSIDYLSGNNTASLANQCLFV